MPGCDTAYTVERDTDALFVSFSISPHDVDDVDKRAVSVCAECGKEIDEVLPHPNQITQ